MVMFGAMYYIVPRLTLCEWPSRRLISLHFWGSSLGIFLYIIPLAYCGIKEGMAMNNPDIPFLEIVKLTIPYLKNRSASGFLIALSQLALLFNFLWILWRWKEKTLLT
jgi:cytochrome c oxidase cbb3-type subunit 1